MTVLYITTNGITTHIGRSQVAPYLLGLAQRGFGIHILSAEPQEGGVLVDQYAVLFAQAGIRWTRVAYRNTPPIIGPLLTQLRLKWAARGIVSTGEIKIVHCRSFQPAVIGYELSRRFNVKFIFDFRDFFADWGLDHTRGIKRVLFRRLKQLEGPMIRASSKVVCLTERAANVLHGWYMSDESEARARFKVIPCCADFSHFDRARYSENDLAVARAELGIALDEFVLIYLGSLGTDYLLDHMIALFRQVLAVHPSAAFLFVSNNGEDEVTRECRIQGVDPRCIRFVTVGRELVPLYICLADLSVIFIRADHTKAGCSPTKLAELFACEVPVIANSGVGDLDSIISPDVNGSLLVADFADATLRRAVEAMAAIARHRHIDIRKNSRQFALEEGIARYADVYRELNAG